MTNTLEFKLWGDFALFTDPVTKTGGEKLSYPIPTYEAMKGIVESVYWKPSITWVIDSIRVMNPIRMETKGIRPITMMNGNSLAYYTYLRDVCYQVRCHFIFNEKRPDLKADWNEKKHIAIANRALKRGGRRDIFLGTRECQAYIEPCVFGEGKGYYDDEAVLTFGVMFHGYNYLPTKDGKEELQTRLWTPVMRYGQVDFLLPEQCTLVRSIRTLQPKTFEVGKNFSLLEESETN